MQLESYRSATGRLELCVLVFRRRRIAALYKKCWLDWAGARSGVVFADSTHVKVHADGSNPAGGQAPQAIGRTKGGLNTKIHVVVNAHSQAIIVALSSGNEADICLAGKLTECLPKNSTLIGDKAYDSSTLRQQRPLRELKPAFLVALTDYDCHILRKALPASSSSRTSSKESSATAESPLAMTNLPETFLGFVCLAIVLTFRLT